MFPNKLYSHHGTGTRFKSSHEHQDLRQIQHFVAVNRKYFVEVNKLERLLDEAHHRNNQYTRFVEVFKNRYPSQYKDVVEEFNKYESENSQAT